MHKNDEFILTPMSDLIHQAGMSLACLKGGLSSFPIFDYVFQSLFLRLTGFQEQKLKCICWELATEDYAYRYKRILSGKLGECSNYEDKRSVLADLVKAISKLEIGFKIAEFSSGFNTWEITTAIYHFYEQSGHLGWMDKAYQQYHSFAWSSMYGNCIRLNSCSSIYGKCSECNSKGNCSIHKSGAYQNLVPLYNKSVYEYRNLCAHNVMAQQRNRPPLIELCEKEDIAENYLVRFLLLLMIDEVMMQLYRKWVGIR